MERLSKYVKVIGLGVAISFPLPSASETEDQEQLRVALSLAKMLVSARQVIGENQDLINDATLQDKGLTPERVLNEAIENYIERTGHDPRATEDTTASMLIDAQLEAISEVVAENQSVINRPGMGFKGFVPAVFARLVNERFVAKVGDRAKMKVTAPMHLVRNRRARPDEWERQMIDEELSGKDWPRGAVYSAMSKVDGRSAFRVMVPEYYHEGCLACHGGPKGEMDITGYPKEGGELDDLGGAISVTLFQ